ncbi:MAG: acyl carrier protein [Gammaproteobacteria bacterium]|nr:acyl carrier protein [Gammaproteobacteria bacterium]
MDKKSFLMSFNELLELEADEVVTGESVLSSIQNWDSLAVLGFIAMADQNFGIVVQPECITKAVVVDDLFNLLDKANIKK